MEGALIVDDDQLTRYAVSKALHSYYSTIKAVSSGTEALQEISSCTYHTCFLDIALPGVNGLRLLKRIQELSPDTRIVIITGVQLDDDLKSEIEGASFSFLTKPFAIRDLKAIAGRAVGRTEKVPSEPNRRAKRDLLSKAVHYSITVLEMGKPISLNLKGDLLDISELGVGIRTSYPLEPGHLLMFTSGLEHLENKAGIVKWSVVGDDTYMYRAGIEFIES